MGSIKCDVNKLNSNVKSSIKSSNKSFSEAINTISSISIPSDFGSKGTIAGMKNRIRNVQSQMNSIEKWVTQVVTKFQNIEKKNNMLVNGMLTGMAVAGNTGININTGAKASSIRKNSNSNSIISSFMKFGESIKLGMTSTGSHVASKWNSALKTASSRFQDMLKLEYKTAVTKAASVGNTVISLLKGVGEFGESLLDLSLIVSTAANTTKTLAIDGVKYLVGKGDGLSVTKSMWKKTMSFVAENHVESAYKKFYKDTAIGKFLDENAWAPFKSDGMVSEIASGVGYMTGIAVVSALTFGAGGAAIGGATAAGSAAGSAAGTAGIAGMSAMGKYTAEFWEKARDETWEGIKEKYKNEEIEISVDYELKDIHEMSDDDWSQVLRKYINGHISKVGYNTMKRIREMPEEQYEKEKYKYGKINESYKLEDIREMSDDDWRYILRKYIDGDISQEEYQKMISIREIPEDWRNVSSAAKGIIYGALNGLWEGVQWFAGAKLEGFALAGVSKLTNSVIRVGIDTGFNAIDTPFRTIVDAVTSDKSLKKSWEEQGGWGSIISSVGVGLIGSVGGEIFENIKSKKLKDVTSENTELKNNIEEAADTLTEKLENNVREVTDNLTERLENNIEEVADTLKNVQNDEPIRLKNATEIAEFFKGNRQFTNEQSDLLWTYTAYSGPVYTAYLRGNDVNFENAKFLGQKQIIEFYDKNGIKEWSLDFQSYLNNVDNALGLKNIRKGATLNGDIIELDKIIEESEPLKKSIILSRNINGLTNEKGEYLSNINQIMGADVGTVFTDRAFVSTSADTGWAYSDRPFKMEIEVAKGSKVAYIQAEVASRNGNNWFQQEVLIGRNKGYELKENVEWRKEILAKKQKDSIKSRLDKTERGKLKDIIKKRTGLSEKEIDKIVGNMELKLTEKEKKDAIKGIAYEQTDEIKAAIKSAQEGKIKKSLLHNGIRELSEKDIESIKLTKEEKLKIIKSVNYFNDEKKEFGHYIIKTKLKEDGIDNVVSNVKKAIQTKENLKYFDNVAKKDRLKGIKQLDLSDIAKEMQEDGTLARHIAELRDINNSKLYEGVSMPEHGIEHVESVLLSAMYIGKKEQITEKDMDLLVEAAKFHDCGRGIEGIIHGLEGANGAETYLKKNYSNEDLAKIKVAIEYHAIPDNQQDLENLLDKYHITKIDEREKTKKIANALKDADALDRVRFPGNLNERYLRTDTSKEMIQALYQMHEIRGTEYLKSLDLTPELKTKIKNLKKEGFSDYELAFWLKNTPKDGEGFMPVWQTINNRIKSLN